MTLEKQLQEAYERAAELAPVSPGAYDRFLRRRARRGRAVAAIAAGLALVAVLGAAVLVLRYYEDLSEAEIARVLGIPAGTVKTLARRGLARLRRSLDATNQSHTLSTKERS